MKKIFLISTTLMFTAAILSSCINNKNQTQARSDSKRTSLSKIQKEKQHSSDSSSNSARKNDSSYASSSKKTVPTDASTENRSADTMSKSISSSSNMPTSQDEKTQKTSSNSFSNTNKPNNSPKFSSAAEAENYLKRQLHLENNTDIIYGNSDKYNGSDVNGQYYTVSLKSISAQKKGGTGSIAIYKIYQSGSVLLINGGW